MNTLRILTFKTMTFKKESLINENLITRKASQFLVKKSSQVTYFLFKLKIISGIMRLSILIFTDV